MESNNYKGIHIISEAVVVGGIAMYLYKKISEMEATIEDLKAQVTMQNNQIRHLISPGTSRPHCPLNSSSTWNNAQTTPLTIPTLTNPMHITHRRENFEPRRKAPPPPVQQICEGGVCKLVPKQVTDKVAPTTSKKMVSISKVSKQIEFDRENMERDETFKVKTFTKSSPNPLLKSVTPNPSVSTSEMVVDDDDQPSELDKILNDIDEE